MLHATFCATLMLRYAWCSFWGASNAGRGGWVAGLRLPRKTKAPRLHAGL
jgi:hypothetical protein